MAQDDPFTLDLFGNTALSSGLGLGVTAFAGVVTAEPDDDDDPDPSTPAPATRVAAAAVSMSSARRTRGANFHLASDRGLAKGWKDRARDNIAAIRLAAAIEADERPATPAEQEQLIRFTGFGASELANSVFRRPGEAEFRKGWEAIGEDLQDAVADLDHASLARCTQYAHFTPEFIVRAIWAGLQRLGWHGGRVLEPGIGTGLFPALMPEGLREISHVTGIELDPVTARIVRLLQPRAWIIAADFARTELPASFDLAIGNPPFSDRTVRSDRAYRSLGLRLHDYFIARAIDLLKPGALAAFVTSSGTMDKADASAREHIAKSADLIAAIRLPEGSFRASAGTDVVVDILFFRKRKIGDAEGDRSWLDVDDVRPATEDEGSIRVNRWFAGHPDYVLGTHALASGPFGETYTCRQRDGEDLDIALTAVIALLPEAIYDGEPDLIDLDLEDAGDPAGADLPSDRHVREGSYFFDKALGLMQILDGRPVAVKVRQGRSSDGVPEKHVRIIRKLIPIRDAVREVLKAQEFDRPWKEAQVRLRIAWSNFVRDFGPINFTTVSMVEDEETGEVRETHRRPNIQPFLDDPDCWLVASIEDYDLETNTAKPGPIFTDRVISPPAPPVITSAADALAVVLNERGRVDVEHIAELLHRGAQDVVAELGSAIFRDPADGSWQTADGYLSGHVRDKLKVAEAATALDPSYERNVTALRAVQPADLSPSDITARLGAPWIPAADIVAFVKETMDAEIKIHHMPELASWTVEARQLAWMAAGTSEWGTDRRHAGELLADALNSRVPQIFDIIKDGDSERRVLNVVDTEAAKTKLQKIKDAFQRWIWSDPDRTNRLARLYNDRFNNIAPRAFDGSHLKLPGASGAFTLYGHQKRGIWRIVSAGSTYLAHAVGAGKTMTMAAAIVEQRRLGLIAKAMLVVPGHCLAQAAREFLALYPNARILVADETNFTKDKRHRFLSRAATATWDAIIITHSAFRFIAVPSAFEQQMIQDELELYETLLTKVESDDRVSRKRLERLKEGLKERLESLSTSKDELLTISEIGVDQIIVDEAQEFRKLSFATNMSTLKGVDPNGSQRAWDLYVKARFIETKNPGRALVLASGTPITNTLGEMFSVQRYLGYAALLERGLHEFDAWASTFGDVSTELELQPSGKYKPVTRFATFVNVPELIAMFRSFADVVVPEDLRRYVKVPALSTGRRQMLTSKPSPAFRSYQVLLDQRIKAIEMRDRPPEPGDDILLSVITDGRHAAIDLRLVEPGNDNEPDNKLNNLIANAFRIWRETAENTYVRPDGKPFERPGAAQMIFSDLGTISVEKSRGFSAYRWIRDELIRMGVPPSEIAFMQDYKKSEAKQRLFSDVRAGKVRFLIGSSDTMGTGVNAQLRLKALHHLDVPWLPSQIEQREGRIVRQGNQHDQVDIFAYATEGSLDATMWQNNERKARFIAAALSGDTSIRRLEDLGEGQANQFAMAKAIASGDPRLMQKAGLEADIARLERLRAAHVDDQHAVCRQIRDAECEIEFSTRRITEIGQDIERLVPTAGEAFAMSVNGRPYSERKEAGRALMKEILSIVQLQQEGESVIASIGGFDLVYAGERFGRDGYRYTTVLLRTAAEYEIELPVTVTPLGAVARLEHALDDFEGERERFRQRLSDAQRRLAAYQSREGGNFAFAGELADKRQQLAEIEKTLAADIEGAGEARAVAA
ncbi:N12 class adenine-specific DNA methylase/adenine-specific DNA methylase [Bradyrhizobium sp. USDA 4524]|uniref:Eco57I restriction-modification methylase domain-containing protein n=1 Tax=unclassified Bradyrhizobium TaxID=2631580 RepID=UPI00209E08F8|nr:MULTISPECIES: helicase-related protein [unclassified Bradyrhizobium]MCP1845776.1 N12 class adenine-specific DNA methylase/adenine-specific DNA methylase [Bradyrhizobium sp. USDA 4538]MCP1906901.1 N12 class adenine-specific DNA methylase/adenine-specific DNA methylase [Bradyrhizobium sp. USDA 4537]MCP1985376.1 N12 class adenine-specific DNA methylase/adenine-specific DNA methylase [Bradyrhizobium sp. USDA 4539]